MCTSDGRLCREIDRRIIKVNKVFFLLTLSNPETIFYTDEQKANYKSILCAHIKPPVSYTDSNHGNEMMEQSNK